MYYLAAGLRARKQESQSSDPSSLPQGTSQHPSRPPVREIAWPVAQSGTDPYILPAPWAPHPDILAGLLFVGSSFFMLLLFSHVTDEKTA